MTEPNWTQRINEMAWGFKNSAILLNALRVGLFESLGHEWKTAEQVAADQDLDTRAVATVLNALVALEIVRKEGDRFRTEDGARELLLADSPRTLKSIMGHNLYMMRGWARLEDVLRTGEPAPDRPRDEQQMRDFILGMENISRQSSRDVLESIDLGRFGRLLDLGGGPATAAITFARAHPEMQCVVLDLEGPIGIAKEQIAAAGLKDRISTVVGDFHTDGIPGGFDCVYIANIIHMLDEAATLNLLRKARGALKPTGRLLLKDFFTDETRTAPVAAATFSVNMLVNTRGGKTYTLGETRDLLCEAGFTVEAEVDVATISKVVEARPSD